MVGGTGPDHDGFKPEYRPDIDGLRAVAILSVILYHAGIGLDGGYVGVDVFFVISGYLITQVLLTGNNYYLSVRGGLFSFWVRRIRRIVPALIFVLLVVSLVSVFLLMPDELQAYGESLLASSGFYSNVLFYSQAGYFDAPSLSKPLLHTWSLGIEGQFYLLFPLFLLLAPHRPKPRGWGIFALFVASLAGSIYGVYLNPSFTFYMLPTRAWELLFGSILALGFLRPIKEKPVNLFVQVVGFASIGWAIFFFSTNTRFPGASAILPAFGTFAVIYTRSDDKWASPVSYLLERPLLIHLGKISYSLYLWHWPILVLISYVYGRKPYQTEALEGLIIAIVLAVFTYRLVEIPYIRWHHSEKTKRLLLGGLVTAFLALLALGTLFKQSHGLPFRLSSAALAYAAGAKDVAPDAEHCHTLKPERVQNKQLCPLGIDTGKSPVFVVWGDSHAHALYGLFGNLARQHGVYGVHGSYSACPPLLGIEVATHINDECRRFNEAMLDYINRSNINTIFLVAYWSVYPQGLTPHGMDIGEQPFLVEQLGGRSSVKQSKWLFEKSLEQTVQKLTKAGRTIYILEQFPESTANIPLGLARATLFPFPHINYLRPSMRDVDARQSFVDGVFKRISEKYPITLIRTHDFFCWDGYCQIESNGRSLYRDSNHLSNFGANYAASILKPIFEKIGPSSVREQ